MTRRERLGFLVALLIISIGMTVALWRQQVNFDDHTQLDANSCHRATLNRQLIGEALQTIADDPATSSETRAKLHKIDAEVQQLITHADCDDQG